MFNFSRYSCLLRLCLSGMLLLILCITSFSTVQAEEFDVVTDSGITFNLRNNVSVLSLNEDDDTNGMLKIRFRKVYYNSSGTSSFIDRDPWVSSGNNVSAQKINEVTSSTIASWTNNKDFADSILIDKMDLSAMYEAGSNGSISITGISSHFTLTEILFSNAVTTKDYYLKNFGTAKYYLKLYRQDSSVIETISNYDVGVSSNGTTFSVNFNMPDLTEDVYKVELIIRYNLIDAYGLPSGFYSIDKDLETGALITGYVGYLYHGISNGNTIFTYDDGKVQGLLGGIIEWVKGIYNATIGLPAQVGKAIGDWIVSLFTPDEEVISSLKSEWDNLLKERFGLVYEAGTIINGVFNGIMVVSEQEYIEIPEVTLDLAGSEFTFGGYEVRIIPEGFEFLQTLVKMMIDICVSILFINAMRKTYDRIFGG